MAAEDVKHEEEEKEEEEEYLVIEGGHYPLPTMDELDNDEAMILYNYSRITIEDFLDENGEELPKEEQAKLTRHPGFKTALVHIAYRRGNRGMSEAKIKAVAGRTNWLDAIAEIAGDDEDGDARPPDEPSSSDELTKSSEPSSPSSPATSGDASAPSSDEPDETLRPTGTSESVTPPTSDPRTSDE